jgi:hypothetical protein
MVLSPVISLALSRGVFEASIKSDDAATHGLERLSVTERLA